MRAKTPEEWDVVWNKVQNSGAGAEGVEPRENVYPCTVFLVSKIQRKRGKQWSERCFILVWMDLRRNALLVRTS